MTETILCFVVFYALAAFVGIWGDVILAKRGADSLPVFRIAFGGCLLTAIGMFSCLLCAMTGSGVTVCAVVMAACVAAAGLAGLIVRRSCRETCRISRGSYKASDIVSMLIMVAVVALQILAVTVFGYEGTDVIRPLSAATVVYDTGRITCADPMMLLIGTFSRILGIHPLRFVYTVSPAIFITLYYLCYYGVISILFCGKKRMVAFVAVCALNLWGYQSQKLAAATLLLSWFGIWVYVIHGVFNIAAVIMLKYFTGRKKDTGTVGLTDDIPEEWDMNKHRIINARNLAIALGVLAVLLVATVFVLNSKINRLYDATVNLQTDLDSRCSLYEFTGDGGQVEGYLLRGSDGSTTFIGGGGADNADMLAEFLGRYTDKVTTWYVYADTEEESGAMKKIMNDDVVDIGNVYIIDRKEITDLQ